MSEASWLGRTSPAFRLAIATSWLAPTAWHEVQEQSIREAICDGFDWVEYLRLVDRHRTPVISWAALKRVPELKIPGPIKQQLQNRSDASRMQAVRHSLQLVGILKGFNGAGIPVMPLKGPILSSQLYGDVGLRQFHDLDLACTLEDIPRAQTCLENLGWRLDPTFFPLTPRQWESFLRHEVHLGFVHPHRGCLVELHWRNRWESRNETTARWARSIPSIWQGCSYLAMRPTDQVLYLCDHGGEHAWSRAKWLGDLARIYVDGRIDWEAILAEARITGQQRALLACLRLLNEVYRLPLPELSEEPWEALPLLLVEIPLRTLMASGEPVPPSRVSVASLRYRLRMNRYDRLLRPRNSWRASVSVLLHRREDFRILRLPDCLFWAYAPLHPVLWVWRWVRRNRPVGD